jgi:cyclase
VIKKRLVGVVTVKDGWAVQSFGYARHLPLGRPEVLVENLDRWGADEILVQCIDRSRAQAGPDLALLERIGRLGLSTPLIYSGGIRDAADGLAAVQAAADRICIDSMLHDRIAEVHALSGQLGAQALIAALPLSHEEGRLQWLDHRTGRRQPLGEALLGLLAGGVISEALLIDWRHEGHAGAFDEGILAHFPLEQVPLIAFGGLSEPRQLRAVLQSPRVAAAAVGNFLSHREHAIQRLKLELAGIPLRPASFHRTLLTP